MPIPKNPRIDNPMHLQRYNGGPSIYSLPVELVIQIFTLYGAARAELRRSRYDQQHALSRDVYRDERPFYGTCWTPLMRVCRFWREIAIATPLLWRRIDVWANTEWLALALARSHQAPFELALHKLHAAQDVVQMLLPHASRLRVLRLPCLAQEPGDRRPPWDIDDISWLLSFLTSGPSPRLLNKLTLPIQYIGICEDVLHLPIDITETSLPALRILRIACAALPWEVRTVSRLTRLDLNACVHSGARMSCDGFLHVLENCHSLEELRLMGGFVSSALAPGALDDARTVRTLELHKLRKLFLVDVPAVTSWLLSCFEFRENISISVRGWILDGDMPPNPFCSLLPPGGDLSRLFPGTTTRPVCGTITSDFRSDKYMLAQIKLSFDEPLRRRFPLYYQDHEIASEEAELTLELEAVRYRCSWQDSTRHILEDFSAIFSDSYLETLDVQGDLGRTDNAWADFLPHFPDLSELTVYGKGSTRSLFEVLGESSPRDRHGVPVPPLCPDLQTLSLFAPSYQPGELQLLVNMAEHRQRSDTLAQLESLSFSAQEWEYRDFENDIARCGDRLAKISQSCHLNLPDPFREEKNYRSGNKCLREWVEDKMYDGGSQWIYYDRELEYETRMMRNYSDGSEVQRGPDDSARIHEVQTLGIVQKSRPNAMPGPMY